LYYHRHSLSQVTGTWYISTNKIELCEVKHLVCVDVTLMECDVPRYDVCLLIANDCLDPDVKVPVPGTRYRSIDGNKNNSRVHKSDSTGTITTVLATGSSE
jgi:hypothetical protein